MVDLLERKKEIETPGVLGFSVSMVELCTRPGV